VVKVDPTLASAPAPRLTAPGAGGSAGSPWPPIALAISSAIALALGGAGLLRHYGLAGEGEIVRRRPRTGLAEQIGDALANAWDRIRLGR
jgi:hypothetical protein